MKISEALLIAFREAGAEQGIDHVLIQQYITKLHKAEYLCHDVREVKPGEQQVYVLITEKGLDYLRKAGL